MRGFVIWAAAILALALSVPSHGQINIGNTGSVSISSTGGSIGTVGNGYLFGVSGAPTYSPTVPWANISGAPTAFAPNGTASGDLCGSYPSPTICKFNGSQSLTGVQGTTGSKVFICTGLFTSGHYVTVDANGNCVDGGAIPGGSVAAGTGIDITSGAVNNDGNTDDNFVTKEHADPSGTNDITSILSSYLNSGSNLSLYIPCGTYKQLSPITVNATSNTGKNLRIYAASPDCVTINLFSGDGWFFNNTSVSGDNNFGPTIEGIVFNDSSGTCAVHSAVRIAQYANIGAQDWKVTNFCGIQYQTGTVTVTNNSQTATISGGSCPAGTAAGDLLWVAGKFQEIASCSGTAITLTIPWQQATATSTAYSLDRNGEGLILDGGGSYVQYNKNWLNIRAVGVRVGVHALGTNVSAHGVSRFDFGPSFINCSRVNDSMAFMLGDDSDTFTITTKVNNCSRFAHLENSHANVIDLAKFENDNAATPAFGCTASPNVWSCNVFVEAIGSNSSNNARGNKVTNSYAYFVGTGVSWDQYDTNFVVAFNDFETFSVDKPVVPPATSTSGYTTAEVHDPTMQLLPGGLLSVIPVSVTIPSATIPALQCYGPGTGVAGADSTTAKTFVFTGVTTSVGIGWLQTGDTAGLTGYGSSNGIMLESWASAANQGSYKLCNVTSASITTSAITVRFYAK